MPTISVRPDGFSLDGEPLRLLSGTMHYFRVHPDQWLSRLQLLRTMGLNTVETYVAWNLHEPEPGVYDFTGFGDIERFLELSAEVGLHAIVRPGPYICAEWDNGGLPAWLTGMPGIHIRTSDPDYLHAVDRWFDALIPCVTARQVTHGGNVVLVQVENEYGAFGSDQRYLQHLAEGLVERGVDVPLCTSDNTQDPLLTGGTTPGHLATVNFGSRPDEAFAALRRFRPQDPPMCMEFWTGWFDHWGEQHHTRDPRDAAEVLDRMLAMGASVNLYVAHGGTNFGCSAGANHLEGRYQPTVTSYDYDAPIDERGTPTEKFWRFREVLGRYTQLPPAPDATPPASMPSTATTMTESVQLLNVLGDVATHRCTDSAHPPTFEELGLAHGLALYRSRLPGPRTAYALTVPGLADRAQVMVDGEHVATLERDGRDHIDLAVPAGGCTLELLVESMGRVNYGPLIGERKGLVGGVEHAGQQVHGWSVLGISLPELPKVPWAGLAGSHSGPTLHRGTTQADALADTFVALPGWTKGYVWVNGFCLGRYWQRGAQQTLYAPAPLLKRGDNEIVVLELDGCVDPVVELRGEPALGEPLR